MSEYSDCQACKSIHDEPTTEHWWSGWPGAYCLKCGMEDKREVCMGNGCDCHCHDEFWEDYAEYMRQLSDQMMNDQWEL